MKNIFRFPYLLWLIIWGGLSVGLLYSTINQHDRHWRSTITRVQTVDFNLLHSCLPYSIAFLEEHQRIDLINDIINSNFGLFAMVYTDIEGNIKNRTNMLQVPVNITASTLDKFKFSYVYKVPYSKQIEVRSPYDDNAFQGPWNPIPKGDAYGRLYLLRRGYPTFLETILNKKNWKTVFYSGEQIPDYFYNILVNIVIIYLVLLPSVILIAMFQDKYQKEVEDKYKQKLSGLEKMIDHKDIEIEVNEKQLKEKDEEINNAKNELEEISNLYNQDSSKYKEAQNNLLIKISEFNELEEEHKILIDENKQLIAEKDELQKKAGKTKPDQFTKILEYAWPNIIFSNNAKKEMISLYYNYHNQKNKILSAISLIASVKDDSTLRQYMKELKTRQAITLKNGQKKFVIKEAKIPPSRIYFVREDKKTYILYVVLEKTTTTDSIVDNYLKKWDINND